MDDNLLHRELLILDEVMSLLTVTGGGLCRSNLELRRYGTLALYEHWDSAPLATHLPEATKIISAA